MKSLRVELNELTIIHHSSIPYFSYQWIQFGWDALLETNKTEDEYGNPIDRSQFNENQYVEGGLEKEGHFGSYDQLRMLGISQIGGVSQRNDHRLS